MFFLWLEHGYGFGVGDHKQTPTVIIPYHDMYYQNDPSPLIMTLITQLETVFVGSLHHEISFYFPLCILWPLERSHCAWITLQEWELCSFSLEATWITYLIFSFFFEFLPLFWMNLSHLFISVWIHGYFFYGLGYNSILLYFTAQLVPAFGALIGYCVSLTHSHQSSVCVCMCVCTFSWVLLTSWH